ncbi:MAG: diacylglycerol kinase [Proteobacteria bacterium]|nr:diacylglycerol kinase [Pseudomonadota bacterium]MBU1686841.1 diacylglycerol kinase [Pseudomonadota bacterium]
MDKKPQGIARITKAFGYSLRGLAATYKNEAAFRQELWLYAVLFPIILLLPASTTDKMLLFAVNTLVLIVELLNSAIEAIVDMASPDYHRLAGMAKDIGSAAVLISLLLVATLWTIVILRCYF